MKDVPQEHPVPYNMDHQARAELLAHLVIAQLVACATTGDWLPPTRLHMISRAWLSANGASCPVRESTLIASYSSDIARRYIGFRAFLNPAVLATYYTADRRLDYRLPVVLGIYDVCADYLGRRAGTTQSG